jgi:hypothetical protein
MEKTMSIKNIVFDLGRVLIKFEPKEYIEQNVPEEKREDFYNGIFGSTEWLMLDRGTLSYEDAKKIFKERVPGADKQIDRLFDVDLFEILQPIEENVKLLPKLKEKYNLYILSNFHQPAFEHIFKKYDFFRLFDGHTVSCYYYLLKPEKEIYDTLIDKFNLIPEETVFIDDTKVNIDACEKEGIRGIHLPDYTELKQKLEEFLK